MPDLDELREKINAEEGFARHNGIRVTSLEKGRCTCAATVTEKVQNPHGVAHGALLFGLCDTAAGVAATSLGRSVVSRSADFHFLRPAEGAVTAVGRVVSAGLHMAYCAAEVYDEAGELLAAGSFEMYFLQGPLKRD